MEARYRDALPQLGSRLLLADGGLETWLIFDAGMPLVDFAAFPLLRDPAGRSALRRYFDSYAEIAAHDGVGLVLDTPTWRASPDWATRLGYGAQELASANRDAVELLVGVRERFDSPRTPVVISGCVGPRYDADAPSRMTSEQARRYHAAQVATFADAGADLVTAMTLSTVEEAVGIVLSAQDLGIPVAISFTTDSDGRLPGGAGLATAIETVDALTDSGAAYYLVNCAHPSHFIAALDDATCRRRVRGIRSNASRRSNSELDDADDLDRGDPVELAGWYPTLRSALPGLSVVGGCCGTDERHVQAISTALAAADPAVRGGTGPR